METLFVRNHGYFLIVAGWCIRIHIAISLWQQSIGDRDRHASYICTQKNLFVYYLPLEALYSNKEGTRMK